MMYWIVCESLNKPNEKKIEVTKMGMLKWMRIVTIGEIEFGMNTRDGLRITSLVWKMMRERERECLNG